MTDRPVDSHRPESVNWLELFFDLVVVAAVAVLTEGLLTDPSLGAVGLLALMYGTIWLSWVLVVMYTNVAGERTRTRVLVIAMFLIAVMVATVPLHHPQRANLFLFAVLALRGIVSGNAMRTGRVLASWPLLQTSGASAPWIVSFWVHAPGKYYLWAAGLVLELLLVLLRGGLDADQAVEAATERAQRQRRDRRDRGQRRDRGRRRDRGPRRGIGEPQRGIGERPAEFVAVDVDRSHLDERLGLFVIIVLGESVTQLVLAAATEEWTNTFDTAAITGFVLLIGLWWLTFVYGFAGAPHTTFADLPPRFGLPLHLLSTLGLVGVAAGLGGLVHSSESLPTVIGWVLGGGLALHFAVGAVCGIAGNASLAWLLGWAVPSSLAAVVIGLLAPRLPVAAVGWLLLVPVLWQVGYGQLLRRRRLGASALTVG
ncbi:low temperature requirement protein A [Nakamurella lactea]|uniref:low temperature requirement protein A n=1 Tax=Nakamurella lactea TaxID=459515 RepID=UPI00137793D0|nr:low temperature requirement protein A [Nakamurella lactea]